MAYLSVGLDYQFYGAPPYWSDGEFKKVLRETIILSDGLTSELTSIDLLLYEEQDFIKEAWLNRLFIIEAGQEDTVRDGLSLTRVAQTSETHRSIEARMTSRPSKQCKTSH